MCRIAQSLYEVQCVILLTLYERNSCWKSWCTIHEWGERGSQASLTIKNGDDFSEKNNEIWTILLFDTFETSVIPYKYPLDTWYFVIKMIPDTSVFRPLIPDTYTLNPDTKINKKSTHVWWASDQYFNVLSIPCCPRHDLISLRKIMGKLQGKIMWKCKVFSMISPVLLLV